MRVLKAAVVTCVFAVTTAALTSCAQPFDGSAKQQYAQGWCMQMQSLQRLDTAFRSNNVVAITAAARQVDGNAQQVLRALVRPEWPRSTQHEIAVLRAGEEAVAANARAIAASDSMPEVRRVPAPPHDRVVGLYEADQSRRARVKLYSGCSG